MDLSKKCPASLSPDLYPAQNKVSRSDAVVQEPDKRAVRVPTTAPLLESPPSNRDDFRSFERIVRSTRACVALLSLLLCSSLLAFSQAPTISSVSPTSGVVGTQVTIIGANFGATQGTSALTFNGTPATSFTSWSATSIVTAVPTGATTGSVVVTVGTVASNSVNFTIVPGSFTQTGNLATARMFQTATLLNNGMVLVAGGVDDGFLYDTVTSAELYNPATGAFTTTGNLNTGRIFNTATLLNSGQVLVAGGSDSNWNQIGTAELYDPTSSAFTFTGSLNTPRTSHTATVLNNGQVLIAGGWTSNGDYITSDAANGELYDPTSGTFVATGSMNAPRDTHTATLLNNGTVLITGGFDSNSNVLSSAEIYDPMAGAFTLTGSLNIGRAVHTATLLNNGMVLIAGGYDINGNAVASAELYNPETNTFTLTGGLNVPRYDGTQGALLNNGTVLLAGGQDNNGNTLASAEIYDPVAGTFTLTGNMNSTRQSFTTTLLNNGQVLVAAGMDFNANVLNSAELYQPSTLAPGGLVSIAVVPTNLSLPVGTTELFIATGTFSNYSTQILASATWTSSDGTVVAIANDPADRGEALAIGQGSATITACDGSVCGSTVITVFGPPSITNLSPTSGPVGSLVTVTGTNFGSTQATSTLTFNGTIATTIMSWSPSSITTLVPNGATTGNVVVVVDGIASSGLNFAVTSTTSSNTLNIGRYQHSATLLNNGTVLIAGGATCPSSGSCNYLSSAEIYNPVSGSSTTTGSVATQRMAPSVLLPNGNVLIAGGSTCDGYGNCFSLGSAEIYSPVSGTFSSAGNLQVARDSHTMTLLSNGTVLIVGGESCVPRSSGGGGPSSKNFGDPLPGGAHLLDVNFTPTSGAIACTALASAEIYDPQAGTFTLTGSLNTARYDAAASQLANGQILIVGGSNEYNPVNSAEIYNPSTGSFTTTSGGLNTARSSPAATLLNSGLVLISGGSTCESPTCPTNTAEVYDPNANTFQYTSGNMNAYRVDQTATLLTNGQVLLAGGTDGCSGNPCTSDATTELYNPSTGTFTSSQELVAARSGHSATLLANGSVLLAGGIAGGTTLSSVEFYQPSSISPTGLVSISVAPANASVAVGGVQQFVATGTFSDNSTSTLQSVSWSSSNSSVALINNAASDSGFALGTSLGSTTISATIGTLSGSTTLTVSPPVQSSGFTTTSAAMATSLYARTATRLMTGQVLVAGGMSPSGVANNAQLYSPTNQTFTSANSMNVARWLHSATLLNDGTVLIAGGSDLANEETLDTAEIYNPTTGTFTLLSNTLNTARVGHTATLLNSGQVLIVGGYDPDYGLISDAELYDPPTQTFIDLGDTNVPRYKHTATILQSGQVLIAGGETDPTPTGAYNVAELYNLASQTFTPVSVPMTTPREGQAAALLNNGQVLITGGNDPATGPLNTAELYDPTSDVFFVVTGTMTTSRISHVMTLLNGGQVLIVGGASGANGTALASTETYNPVSQLFTAAGSMASVRESQTDTLLNDGTVLICGGTDGTDIFSTAELYMASQLSGLTSIAVTPASPSIGLGTQQLFAATGTFSNGNTESLASVLWSSSSTGVATINNDATDAGVAESLTQGTATLTASALGISGSATLTITTPTLISIQLSPQSPTIPLGATQQFTATGVYSDGSTQDLTSSATWSSSASVVATLNSSGLAAGLFQGVATIQVSSGSVNATTNLNISSAALLSIAIVPASGTIALGASQQYQATGTYSDGSTQNVTGLITWSSASPVATVNSVGLALGVSQGSTTVSASFEGVSTTAELTVGPPALVSLVVTPSGSLSIGAVQQLIATGNYTDGSTQNLTFSSTWTTSNAGVLGISSSGSATAASSGEATITATNGTTTGVAIFFVTSGTTQANLNTSRYLHSATALMNGQILVAGGVNCPTAGSCSYLNSAEIYDPVSSAFTNTGVLAQARSAPAVLLNNGNVLIAGGYSCDTSGNCASLSSAEIYNPSASTFSSAGNMTAARSGHTMSLLNNGTVLIAGGQTCTTATSCSALSSAEIYDPLAGTFTATTAGMNAARFGATAVALSSGSILIVGGFDGTNLPAAAEIYLPTQSAFIFNGPQLNTPRFNATATVLNNGQIVVAGGSTCAPPGCPTNSVEIFDPVANTFTPIANGMNVPRFSHTATLLTNGQVLVAGGFSSCNSSCTSEASTELFDPVAGSFILGQPVANAVAGQTATLTANGNALLIGGVNGGVTVANDEWYQPTSLTPPGLASIAVTPASSYLIPGQTQQLVATGTFNNGSTQSLQSVIWTSSNTSAAAVNNSPGSGGIVSALATGASTVTATAGDVSGYASLNVESLVSLAITPANPSTTVGSGLQLAASGTFSDNSVHDLTSTVSWSSSSPSTVFVATSSSIFPGLAMGANAGTGTISATIGAIQATTVISVQGTPPPPPTPNIISVSPNPASGGTQVTITGSGFGPTQGSGTILLGTTYGVVNSWNDTQIIATVPAISQSGVVQVRQSGQSSNLVPLSVTTTTILSVSPSNGMPGTQVTVTGSDFGATQSGGQVWLGTVPAIVQSWSATQIVATVALGAASGSAQVLQNGVLSNPYPFIVNGLQVTSVSPSSGGPGAVVTINGSGFGSSQGTGAVWLGSAGAEIIGWGTTQILAVVASNSVSGLAKVEQNGAWSNAVPFTVPVQFGGGGGGGQSVTLTPSLLSLVVGQTQSIEAVSSSGQSVTGLAWTSSNPQIVSLSTDDPPILTALSPGHVSITAGNSSTDVTVYSGPVLPIGTTIWSDPGDGSGVISIVPAVPSSTGVADVFAMNSDCTVQAIASDGTVAWQANIGTSTTLILNTSGNTTSTACNQFLPDFQGGMVVTSQSTSQGANGNVTTAYVQRFDGMTGQLYPAYNLANPSFDQTPPTVLATSAVIFALDGGSVVGIDPTSGNPLFQVQTEQTTVNTSGTNCVQGPPNFIKNISSSSTGPAQWLTAPIVAGDGNLYVAYSYSEITGTAEAGAGGGGQPCGFTVGSSSGQSSTHYRVLRVAPDGSFSKIVLTDLTSTSSFNEDSTSVTTTGTQSGYEVGTVGGLITNADQGVTLSWSEVFPTYLSFQSITAGPTTTQTIVPGTYLRKVTSMNAGGITSDVVISEQTNIGINGNDPPPDPPFVPIVQRQDGSYVGTFPTNVAVGSFSCVQTNMIAFNLAGSQLWVQPNYTPQIATADNGVIANGVPFSPSPFCEGGAGGTATFDQSGNATGQIGSIPTYSWKGAYQDGPVESLAVTTPTIAPVYGAVAGGSPTGKGTAVAVHSIGLFWCGSGLSGTCKGLTDANSLPESDLGFTYFPTNCTTNSPPQNCPSSPQDFTNNTAWVNLIMTQAKQALAAAFKKVPIVPPQQPSPISVSLFGTPKGTPDHVVNIVGTTNVVANNDGAGVTGQNCSTLGILSCSWNSVVYYTVAMNQAQVLVPGLNSPAYPPQTSAQKTAFQNLLSAIGKGIGNTAAHELGHQFQLPDMDCETSEQPNLPCNPPLGGNIDLLYESEQSAAFFLDIGGDLTWDLTDKPILTQELFKTSPNSK